MATRTSPTVPYRPKAGEIPTEPGVYRFQDATGRVLYVGKAKNLRARLSNYFAPLHTLHERTRHMVTHASSVQWTVVGSDFEALQLEYTWIKEFAPPYNVKFRDDKTYPYMVVTLGDEAPRVMVTRNRKIPGARYFGPYPKIWAVRETIDQMVRAFPIRTCSDSSYKRAMETGRPCFPGQIGRCGGPCSMKVSVGEHRRIVDQFVAFMANPDPRMISRLQAEMKAASADLDFERAAVLRDRLAALENVLESSAVVLSDAVDADVFGIEHDELAAAVQQFRVRGGRVRGVRSWVVDKELDIGLPDLVDSVLQSAYDGGEPPPREIIVPELPDDADALEQLLSEIRGRGSVKLRAAQRGEKAALLQTATINAKQALGLYKTRRSADYVARSQALTDLQEALELDEAPLRMECYDVSHLSGTNIVASMVVFEDGLPKKDQYRRFNVADSTDDTESLYQVLSRRLSYLDKPDSEEAELEALVGIDPVETLGDDGDESADDELRELEEELAQAPKKPGKFSYRPNLLIVDGGQPQVQAAARALRDSGVTGIQICGIAKRLEEVWLPDTDYPIILPRNSEALFMIQRIRDEAHRFAITHQRARRGRDITSVLGEIPGLGPARVRELLRHFGSVAKLKKASVEEITAVKGVGLVTAQTVHERLRAR
ncbi:excinuclease ABC subunit UvrC [Herbiconiux sp. L3-i23]|uniref:excinuclease ABC subunit UvrC n=1 Tax=Herbiconiux sp. L3-i23 TaxID=2905871 RepID=UPI002064F099|nr:excinuclease ABC subunit UvrC [Herbiconiux sp. L3-i23]BDI22736.1 UvrABC system protein C [Herbiconiux sp. L3-i23]